VLLHLHFPGLSQVKYVLFQQSYDENEGVAARVFANLDLNITKARAQVVKALGSPEMSNKNAQANKSKLIQDYF
jgi:ATP-dependent Clp protease ATP-binding subunit ClpC